MECWLSPLGAQTMRGQSKRKVFQLILKREIGFISAFVLKMDHPSGRVVRLGRSGGRRYPGELARKAQYELPMSR